MRGENIDLQAGGLLGWSKISTQLLAVLLIEREGGTASKIWIQSRFGIELGQVPSARARTRDKLRVTFSDLQISPKAPSTRARDGDTVALSDGIQGSTVHTREGWGLRA